MTDQVESVLLGLQREYLAAMPRRVEELRSGMKAIAEGEPDAPQALGRELHRLGGSGGSYGFAELSAIAREGERWLMANPASRDTAKVASIIERLAAALQQAERQLSIPAAARESVLTPRATVNIPVLFPLNSFPICSSLGERRATGTSRQPRVPGRTCLTAAPVRSSWLRPSDQLIGSALLQREWMPSFQQSS